MNNNITNTPFSSETAGEEQLCNTLEIPQLHAG
jgi:hypothetical protein